MAEPFEVVRVQGQPAEQIRPAGGAGSGGGAVRDIDGHALGMVLEKLADLGGRLGSVALFKAQAKRHGTKYQKMMREVLSRCARLHSSRPAA